jgi:RNA polymerase sigma factor (TIGR02999 family)
LDDITRLLAEMQGGDIRATDQLLPLLYVELKQMAASRMDEERDDHTLQATALVHEVYLRLVGQRNHDQTWENRRHFMAAAAEAMRRILVENARRRRAQKHGGRFLRVPLDDSLPATSSLASDLLEINELLEHLAVEDGRAAEIVKLRFFAGLTMDEAAVVLGVSPRSADMLWAYARAWLFARLRSVEE